MDLAKTVKSPQKVVGDMGSVSSELNNKNESPISWYSAVTHPVEKTQISSSDTAMIIIDMQHGCGHPDYGLGRVAKEKGLGHTLEYLFDRIAKIATPNIRLLMDTCKKKDIEVIHVISQTTWSGREMSRQYKLSLGPDTYMYKIGSKEAEILPELTPPEDAIIVQKFASGAFNSSPIDTVLRSLEITNLIVTGISTSHCVENAVRAASDIGYNVILIDDATAEASESSHKNTLEVLGDIYCHVMMTDEMCQMINDIKC